ncbi:hypothetical protein SAMN05421780_10973 [Flexibacter flexilis DSM 6793]|uniref:Cytochrome c domain-containing protein n=1 Tax=Flexibacter flexilis DSM 6793 TaxID=927664 RepID=A0A1I1LPM8_9BACT|nr:hypothetical protein [Flexibacter flexilis]SFC74989.1 hypothetical protein SAMN05421780_10973 [Flexibacter flexilis DSM 6793]
MKNTSKILILSGLLAMAGAQFACEREAVVYGTFTGCDTASVTYTSSISPIIDQSCISCHAAAEPSSGISLSNYAQVKTYVDNGKLLGAVLHQSGYQPMPQTGTLTNCEIKKIRNWVNLGAPQ